MTREEATNTLKSLKDCYSEKNEYGYVEFDDEDNEALDMAIKALKEQEPYVTMKKLSDDELEHLVEQMKKERWQLISVKQEPCDDAISRQAVLDYAKDTCLDLDSFEDTEVFCDEIKLLPPVTSQPKMGRWIDNHNNTMSCDRCHTWFNKDDRYGYMHYCPNCGSKMEVENEKRKRQNI